MFDHWRKAVKTDTNTLEVNVVSSDKGKEPKQPGGKKKGKNEKKK